MSANHCLACGKVLDRDHTKMWYPHAAEIVVFAVCNDYLCHMIGKTACKVMQKEASTVEAYEKQEVTMSDNHISPHYMHGLIEVRVAMAMLNPPSEWLGHALKYACRAPHKGKEADDVVKAIECVRYALSVDPNTHWGHAQPYATRVALINALCAGIPFSSAAGNGMKQRDALRTFIQELIHMEAYNPITNCRPIETAADALERAYTLS